ncbi:MAG TPA: hypothetical protein VKY22_09830 [Bradyrhizobium sp.]|nr:hypothetical protein [Bradyrhizobium sp.]
MARTVKVAASERALGQNVIKPNQVVAPIKTKKLVAAATMKQRSKLSMGASLHAHR